MRENITKFSPREIDNMLMSRETAPYTAAFKRLPVEDALKVFSVATPAEKIEFAPLLGNKLGGLDKLSQDRQAEAIQQLRKIGLLK
ncbi:MAG: hypothetical protein HQK99_02440 [Nitrospirae bacterium]|nr:hypothetical protein [Nitrospirota bacterium]